MTQRGAMAEEDDEEDGEEEHVFLTKQPSVIKFGKLKPYQLESLNWMIHLAEKGLNGILADEVSLNKSAVLLLFLICIGFLSLAFFFLYLDGSGKDSSEYFDFGIPLGVSQNSRATFDRRTEVNTFQLDERIEALVS